MDMLTLLYRVGFEWVLKHFNLFINWLCCHCYIKLLSIEHLLLGLLLKHCPCYAALFNFVSLKWNAKCFLSCRKRQICSQTCETQVDESGKIRSVLTSKASFLLQLHWKVTQSGAIQRVKCMRPSPRHFPFSWLGQAPLRTTWEKVEVWIFFLFPFFFFPFLSPRPKM